MKKVDRLKMWAAHIAQGPAARAAPSARSAASAKNRFDKANPFVEAPHAGDTFVQEDTHKPSEKDFTGGSGLQTLLTDFLTAAAEIETHCWEIRNAKHTGMADHAFGGIWFNMIRKHRKDLKEGWAALQTHGLLPAKFLKTYRVTYDLAPRRSRHRAFTDVTREPPRPQAGSPEGCRGTGRGGGRDKLGTFIA